MSHPEHSRNDNGNGQLNGLPDPEVRPKAQRRRYSAEYKRRILQEAEACRAPGEVGALLRREGLYSSHLNTWRQQRQQGELAGLTPAKRGRKVDAQAVELAQLKRENERLQAQLERAELIIDVQKKLSRLLGQSETASDERK